MGTITVRRWKSCTQWLRRAVEHASFKDVVMRSDRRAQHAEVSDHAAQLRIRNFCCYFLGLRPTADRPGLPAAIACAFGEGDALAKALVPTPALQFGSRRGCLVAQRGRLAVAKTISGELPFARGALPLFASDVWGQAYYVDYKNRRHNYLVAAVARYPNRAFPSTNLELARPMFGAPSP